MVEMTIQMSDELAQRLRPLRNRMTEIIELGLRDIAPQAHALSGEIVEFLAGGPPPQAILVFRPTMEAQARVADLLSKNQAGTITPEEQAELDQCESLDYLMTMIKARARQRLGKAA